MECHLEVSAEMNPFFPRVFLVMVFIKATGRKEDTYLL